MASAQREWKLSAEVAGLEVGGEQPGTVQSRQRLLEQSGSYYSRMAQEQ